MKVSWTKRCLLPTELKTYDLLSSPFSSHLQGHIETHKVVLCAYVRCVNETCITLIAVFSGGVLLKSREDFAVVHAGV